MPFNKCWLRVIYPGNIRNKLSFYMCSNSFAMSVNFYLFSKIIRSRKNKTIEVGVFFLINKALSITFYRDWTSLNMRSVTTCSTFIFLDYMMFYPFISTIANIKKKRRNLSFSAAKNRHKIYTNFSDSLLSITSYLPWK